MENDIPEQYIPRPPPEENIAVFTKILIVAKNKPKLTIYLLCIRNSSYGRQAFTVLTCYVTENNIPQNYGRLFLA